MAACVSWNLRPSCDGRMFWTELGSRIGDGEADWDLEEFLVAHGGSSREGFQTHPLAGQQKCLSLLRCSPEGSAPEETTAQDLSAVGAFTKSDASPKQVISDLKSSTEDSSSEDCFWDAGAEFDDEEDENEGLAQRRELYYSPRSGKGDDEELLSGSSDASSEDLDRWMAGSQSFTTEDSFAGSAGSSTLDFSEWAAMDTPAGSTSGSLRSFNLGLRFGLGKPSPSPMSTSPGSGPLNAPQKSSAQEGNKGSIWGLRCLVGSSGSKSSVPPLKSLNDSRQPSEPDRKLSTQGAEQQARGQGASAGHPAAAAMDPSSAKLTAVIEELERLRAHGLLTGSAGACVNPSEAPGTATRLHLLGQCFSPASAAAAGGGGGVLDIIPDTETAQFMEAVTHEDASMYQVRHEDAGPLPARGKNDAKHSRSSPVLKPAEDKKMGKTDDKQGDGTWRLLMKKSTESMEYSSWIQDRGQHFGGMEFRGRMVLMPMNAGASDVSKGQGKKQPQSRKGRVASSSSKEAEGTKQQQTWSPEAVRDFLLDEVHRAEWDDNRDVSEMLEEWDESGCSTVRWVRKLPLFLRSREYVVGRRVWSQGDSPGTYFCISKNVDHPAAPGQKNTIRVSKFYSSWRVRALTVEETTRLQGQLRVPVKGQVKEPETAGVSNNSGAGTGSVNPWEQRAVEIITHYEEDSGLPRDVVRVGVAHGMWAHMLKMELALRRYCASGRNLRHLLPVSLLQAEQQVGAAYRASLGGKALCCASIPSLPLEDPSCGP